MSSSFASPTGEPTPQRAPEGAPGDHAQDIDRRTLLFYALPAIALAMPTIPLYVYLPTFYADTLGLGLVSTGAALLWARVFDVITDPLIGVASDRLVSRWGRRKPWIAAGAIPAAASVISLFNPPDGTGFAYLLGWSLGLYLGWTMVAIPYNAWGAELSREYHERARITGAREAAMILGVLTAGALPAVAAATGGAERDGLAWVSWLAVLIGAPAIGLMLWRVSEQGPSAATRSGRWRELRALLRNGPFARLLSAWFINGLANGLPSVLFLLYLQHCLAAGPVERGALIMTYFLAGILAIPLWLRISRRVGKHRAWCYAMILACLSFVWVPLLGPGDLVPFAVICVLTGMALGADLTLPPALQADVIDYDTLMTGDVRAGLFFALWSMSTKLALAVAVGVAFPLLAAFGFETAGSNSEAALAALAVIYAVIPTVLKIGAIAFVWNHPITLRRQLTIRRRLEQVARRGEGRR